MGKLPCDVCKDRDKDTLHYYIDFKHNNPKEELIATWNLILCQDCVEEFIQKQNSWGYTQ